MFVDSVIARGFGEDRQVRSGSLIRIIIDYFRIAPTTGVGEYR